MWSPTMLIFDPARQAMIRALKEIGLTEDEWAYYEKETGD